MPDTPSLSEAVRLVLSTPASALAQLVEVKLLSELQCHVLLTLLTNQTEHLCKLREQQSTSSLLGKRNRSVSPASRPAAKRPRPMGPPDKDPDLLWQLFQEKLAKATELLFADQRNRDQSAGAKLLTAVNCAIIYLSQQKADQEGTVSKARWIKCQGFLNTSTIREDLVFGERIWEAYNASMPGFVVLMALNPTPFRRGTQKNWRSKLGDHKKNPQNGCNLFTADFLRQCFKATYELEQFSWAWVKDPEFYQHYAGTHPSRGHSPKSRSHDGAVAAYPVNAGQTSSDALPGFYSTDLATNVQQYNPNAGSVVYNIGDSWQTAFDPGTVITAGL